MDKITNRELSPYLKPFIPLVKSLGKTLGKHYEIVLHDISNTGSSIIAIENGHITGRKVGAPATDLLLEILNSEDIQQRKMELNYTTKTKNGKQLKSSTTLIQDDKGNPIGALCINLDLTYVNMGKNFLEEISVIETKETQEEFPEDVSTFLEIMIKNSLTKIDKPVNLLTKEDKVKIVEYLDKNNIFDIKGGVSKLANELKVSKYTIYNYLDEIKARAQ